MTTNAGAAEMDSGSIGINKSSNNNGHKRDKVIKNFFAPEFRNRLSSIIHFNKLDEVQVIQIVEKFVNELSQKLQKRSINLEITSDALKWFAKNGYDAKMGARPLERLVSERLTKPISRELLFGKFEKQGGDIKVSTSKNELKLDFLL